MLFSSMIFIWVFLPVVIIVNFALSVAPFRSHAARIRVKNRFLLAASLFFYAWGGIGCLFLMLFSIAVNYCGGLLLAGSKENSPGRKGKLALVLFVDLGILFVFKYFNMLIVMVEAVLSAAKSPLQMFHNMLGMQGTGELGIAQIALPVGISFFTFQAMSYVIDVYRRGAAVQKNFWDFALYVSFFPQLVAGPIVKYSDIAEQLKEREETIHRFVSGQKRFCYGLGKKVLLANTFAEIADRIFGLALPGIGAGAAWLGILAYTLQIYYDFSGYSDMAIGIGRMLGFSFKENFAYPYTAQSIQEFWRRWHISLSTWFKEYVYIPLGGNRRSAGRTYLNVFLVFLLTGIWHGANFTFLIWGIFYAVLQILERSFLGKVLEKNPVKLLNWMYCLFLVMIGWVFFRSDTIFLALAYLKEMFAGSASAYRIGAFLSRKGTLAFLVGIPCAGFVQRPLLRWYEKISKRILVRAFDLAVQAGILILSILMLVSGTYNPFIYFQF